MAIQQFAPARAPEPGGTPAPTGGAPAPAGQKIDILRMLNDGMTHEQIGSAVTQLKTQGNFVDAGDKAKYQSIAPKILEQNKLKTQKSTEKKDGLFKGIMKDFGRTVAKPFGEVVASGSELMGKQAPKWTENKRLASPAMRGAQKHGISGEAGEMAAGLKAQGAEGAGFGDVLNVLSFLPGGAAGKALGVGAKTTKLSKGVMKFGEKVGGGFAKAGSKAAAPMSAMTKGTLSKFSKQYMPKLAATAQKQQKLLKMSGSMAKWGGAYGGAEAIDEGKSFGEVVKSTALGATVGAVLPVGLKGGSVLARKIASKIPGLSKFATSQITGLSPKTIETLIHNPKAVTGAQKTTLDRAKLGSRVKSGIQKRLDDLGTTGKEYNVLRDSTQKVSIPKSSIDSVLGKYKVKFKDGKIITSAESIPMSQTDKTALKEFMSVFGKGESMSSNAFLNARTALSNMAGFEQGKTGASKKLAKELRVMYDKAGKSQIKGLEKLDAQFAPEVKLLKEMKKTYFDKDGELKSTALTKIANLTKKGREKELGKLENIVPGIREDVNVLRALEDIEYAGGQKVGSYFKGAAGGFVLSGGNPLAAALTAIASSPTIAVPMLIKYGEMMKVSSAVMETIVTKMLKGVPLQAGEKATIGSVLKKISTESIEKRTTTNKYTPKIIDDVFGATQKKKILNSNEFKAFDRYKGLSEKDSAIQEASIEKFLSNKDKLVKEYRKEFGTVVNADDARSLYKDVGYVGSNAAAVHEASSSLAKEAWKDVLKTSKGKDAYFLAGGSGSGKSSATKDILPDMLLADAPLLDSTLSSVSSAEKYISQAVKSGKSPQIVYVYRDPVDSFVNGVVKRMKSSTEGRVVPVNVTAKSHIESWNTMQHLHSQYQKAGKADSMMRFIDNSKGYQKHKAVSFDDMKASVKPYSKDELVSTLNNKVKELYGKGEITLEQKNQLLAG